MNLYHFYLLTIISFLSTETDGFSAKFRRKTLKITSVQLHGDHLVNCIQNPAIMEVDPALCEGTEISQVFSALGADMLEQALLLGFGVALYFTLKRRPAVRNDFSDVESEEQGFEGEFVDSRNDYSRKCPQCNGLGSLPWLTGGPICDLCDGTGSVNVPPRSQPLKLPPSTRRNLFDS